MTELIAFTDGGCRGNPGGIGGWGFVLVERGSLRALERAGGEASTTNNRMEMLAAIKALSSLRQESSEIRILSDSKYLINCCTTWIVGWKAKGWRRGKDPLKNLDLLKRLDVLIGTHAVRFQWVPGHAGVHGNEHVDRLANEAMGRIERGVAPAWERRFTWTGPLP